LEFGPISLENTDNAEVLILSGDICVAKDLREKDSYIIKGENDKSNKIHTFFQECCARFPSVIYIAGNHEHYHGDFAKSIGSIRDNLGYLVNLHVLDKESVLINNVLFIGGTLWTDMNKEDGITLMHMKDMMNDFRCVQNSNRVTIFKDDDGKFHKRESRFSPEDAVVDHKAMLEYIRLMIEGKFDQKFVVIGHHAPSKLSTKPRYEKEVIMNGGYSTALDEFIMDHPQIKLWTHGHTHEDFDYMVGSTRIVCNPRGYDAYEERADRFKLKFVEV
jgi:predicted phosphodiesterase